MVIENDEIPVLPSMVAKPRRRSRRRSQRKWMILVLAGTVVGLGLLAIWMNHRQEQLAENDWKRAQALFEQTSFDDAAAAFELFGKEHPEDRRTSEATAFAELSALCQRIRNPGLDSNRIIALLDAFASNPDHSEMVAEHWTMVATLAERQVQTLLERAERSDLAADLDTALAWLAWIRRENNLELEAFDLEPLDRLADKIRQDLDQEAALRAVLTKLDTAIGGEPDAYHAALEAAAPYLQAPEQTPSEIRERLSKLRERTVRVCRFLPVNTAENPGPDLPLLALEDYARLAIVRSLQPVGALPKQSVVLRFQDLCYGIDPAEGKPIWVARVGYDAPPPEPLPDQPRRLLFLWQRDEQTILTLFDPDQSLTVWSWTAPNPILGKPCLTQDSVYAATRDGSLWKLDSKSGQPLAKAVLPEPIDGALTLNESKDGLCVTGQFHGIYLYDLTIEIPTCSDIVHLPRRSDSLRPVSLWVDPYVVVFENDLVDRCHIRAIRRSEAGYEALRSLQVQMKGRLWQDPVLDGATLFCMTDLGYEYAYGLDPGNSGVSIYSAYRSAREHSPPKTPSIPRFTRSGDQPFLTVSDTIRTYRLDRNRALMTPDWEIQLPSANSYPAMPIQVVGDMAFFLFGDREHDGVLMQARSANNGTLFWELTIPGAVRHWVPVPEGILASTGAGQTFLIRNDRSEVLDAPKSDHGYVPAGDGAVWISSGGTSMHSWTKTGLAAVDLSPPSATPLALVPMPSGSVAAAYVTKDNTLSLQSIDGQQDGPQPCDLPDDDQAIWDWPPVASPIAGEVLLSNRAGTLLRLAPAVSENIQFLQIAEFRSDLTTIDQPPSTTADGLVQLFPDGRYLIMDPESLQTRQRGRLPIDDLSEQPSGKSPRRRFTVSDGIAYAFDSKSVLHAIEMAAEPKKIWQKQLPGGKWNVADAAAAALLLHNRDTVTIIDRQSGDTLWTRSFATPLAAVPVWTEAQVLIALIDGAIIRINLHVDREHR